MNDAVYGFRRYEESSLDYSGINRHAGENIGGFSGAISREDYEMMFRIQQQSIDKPISNLSYDTDRAVPDGSDMINHVVSHRHMLPVKSVNNDYINMGDYVTAEDIIKLANQDNEADESSDGKVESIPHNSSPKTSISEETPNYNVQQGDIVNHKAFGRGTVININEGLISVRFKSETKKFHYPAAFKQGFLVKL